MLQATPPYERAPRERVRYDYSPPPQKFARPAAGHFEEDPYGRVPRYRELPAHRMPHYEDDDLNKRRVRSGREVIVEKADDWSDPWARKQSRRGSAGGRERRAGRERSYSSNSSYSTSSGTSRSRSSSESSGSPSAPRRKRVETHKPKDRSGARKPVKRSGSGTPKRRHSPPGNLPFIFRYFLNLNRIFHFKVRPRIMEKKPASPIPTLKRKKTSPPPSRVDKKVAKKKRDSSSGSGSSSGGSGSESSYSSSTSDSKGKKKREKIVVERKPSAKGEKSEKF